MTTQNNNEILINSKFYNSEYKNFDATSKEAKQFLFDNGLCIRAMFESQLGWELEQKLIKIGQKALTDFIKQENDYSSYKTSDEAKEVYRNKSKYTPLLQEIFVLDSTIVEKTKLELAEKKAKNKNSIFSMFDK
jgi:hypothetical protein